MAAISALSYAAGPELALPVFYVLPVAAVAWFAGLSAGVGSAVVAVLFWLGVDLAHGPRPLPVLFWNTALRLLCLATLSHLLAALGMALRYARTDPLTGIANSRAFYDWVQLESQRSRRYGGAFTIVYLDVDDLRAVNQRFGHAVGDALIRSVAAIMRNSLRTTDVVARLGGDHFAILLPETGAAATRAVLRKLEGVLLEISGKGEWTSTFSLGAVTYLSPPESIEGALNRAEELMYAAQKAPQEAGASRVRCRAEILPVPPQAAAGSP
jgi:diguanylate cyclase (GGDEF)-like protein